MEVEDGSDQEEITLGTLDESSFEIPEPDGETFEGDEWLRIPCFAHTLQLVVSDGFKESSCFQTIMAKVSNIAKFR